MKAIQMKKLNYKSNNFPVYFAGEFLFLLLHLIVFVAKGSAIPKGGSLGYRPSPATSTL
ncbi:hypothetical protein [Chryseobacterium wangxinyae]|uniref:hypothetical protein n=1 Tax=Chryseobacterium sp. CY353 TaxID=2997334 RepID=UPI00226FB2A2|nr:hypothetical protein [Chryseobacterium sp. CY353]MCY0969706.1 hypothetical protein [Chryseobacterium sp. CY353]